MDKGGKNLIDKIGGGGGGRAKGLHAKVCPLGGSRGMPPSPHKLLNIRPSENASVTFSEHL